MSDTNELRRLLADATPGPWGVSYGYRGECWQVFETKPDGTPYLNAKSAFDDGSAGGEYGQRCTPATRDLIVAAVNALPAMLDELDAARARIKSLEGCIVRNMEAAIRRIPKAGAARCDPVMAALAQASQERDAARADLREAMELLRAHGQAPGWLLSVGKFEAVKDWNRRYGELLAKHKETP